MKVNILKKVLNDYNKKHNESKKETKRLYQITNKIKLMNLERLDNVYLNRIIVRLAEIENKIDDLKAIVRQNPDANVYVSRIQDLDVIRGELIDILLGD